MKHYLPKNTEDGAALIITLLIVVLLATISVSFFSTARIEQTATRNYTSKTQAEQFATMATQQAMAKIQKGFTVNGTATTVITTQPGAIRQFIFQMELSHQIRRSSFFPELVTPHQMEPRISTTSRIQEMRHPAPPPTNGQSPETRARRSTFHSRRYVTRQENSSAASPTMRMMKAPS